jgi:hypothetical protein
MKLEDQIREDFAAASTPEEYREFFLKYVYMTTNDLCNILGVATRALRGKKSKAGLVPYKRKVKAIVIPKEDPPPFEDTPEWWAANYPKYGKLKLAEASRLNPHTVVRRINMYAGGIRPYAEQVRSKHPCNNEEWLRENFEKHGSVNKLAKLAGVSWDAMADWLNHAGIRLNGRSNPILGKIPAV